MTLSMNSHRSRSRKRRRLALSPCPESANSSKPPVKPAWAAIPRPAKRSKSQPRQSSNSAWPRPPRTTSFRRRVKNNLSLGHRHLGRRRSFEDVVNTSASPHPRRCAAFCFGHLYRYRARYCTNLTPSVLKGKYSSSAASLFARFETECASLTTTYPRPSTRRKSHGQSHETCVRQFLLVRTRNERSKRGQRVLRRTLRLGHKDSPLPPEMGGVYT